MTTPRPYRGPIAVGLTVDLPAPRTIGFVLAIVLHGDCEPALKVETAGGQLWTPWVSEFRAVARRPRRRR